MTRSAYQWGLNHGSCLEALEARRKLGPNATQANWWRECEKSTWLIWQIKNGLTHDEMKSAWPALLRALDKITARAVERSKRAERTDCHASRYAMQCAKTAVRYARDAARAVDRSNYWDAATYAKRSLNFATTTADRWNAQFLELDRAYKKESRQQAEDIRAEIPEWPGEL
jgi:hypothetical protein